MKKVIAAVLTVLTVLCAASCGAGSSPETPDTTANEATASETDVSPEVFGRGPFYKNVDFTAQYIRTNGYLDGAEYPKTCWISDKTELSSYVEKNGEIYDLGQETFTDAVKKYGEEFFLDHDLIIVVLEEGSGSVRHEVTKVRLYHSMLDRIQYFIQPEIKRTAPDAGTCDMAEWHILIEIPKEYGAGSAGLQLPVITS